MNTNIQNDYKTMDNKKRDSGKTVLQFWNGGTNSTYLLLQNLLSGNSLVLHYIDLSHNQMRKDKEHTAQSLLIEDINKFCEYFNCNTPQYSEDSKIYGNPDLFEEFHLSQHLTILTYALSLAREFDEVQIGNSCENYATLAQKEMIEAYKCYYRVDSNIIFPLENISKETIYLSLKSYDDLLGTNFLGHISICNSTYEQCSFAFDCFACKQQKDIFKTLKWVK